METGECDKHIRNICVYVCVLYECTYTRVFVYIHTHIFNRKISKNPFILVLTLVSLNCWNDKWYLVFSLPSFFFAYLYFLVFPVEDVALM